MGEGGQIGLINGTSYVWRKVDQKSYQMNTWVFDDQIQPGAVSIKYIEFNQKPHVTRKDTGGNCTYVLDGTNCRFNITVKDGNPYVQVHFENIETPQHPNGSTIDIGFQHDGVKYFILSGKEGNFSSSQPPVDWMHQNLNYLGSKPLAQLCMPGTHDAGMGQITWADNIPNDIIANFTQTQSQRIIGQLTCGSRYFDIRPEVSMGGTWTGHYGGNGSKMGARGQRISEIIDQVNDFTNNNKELIILNLSHAANTDDNFRDYNQGDWDSLMEELLRLNHRFIYTGEFQNDISLLRLEQFIGPERDEAAVICVVEAPDQITLGRFASEGFYLTHQLNVQNEYSNSDDNVRMVNDQIDKLNKHASGGDKRLFLLSWTLTQQAPDMKGNQWLNQLNNLRSIKDLAYSANKSLFVELFPRVNTQAFPNIVYIDFMENNDYAALAMAINHKWMM